MNQQDTQSLVKIYISYPYSDEPQRRIREVKRIIKNLMKHRDSWVLFVPHFAFHAFNKEYGEETAYEHCLKLLSVSDVLCVCLPKDQPLTCGMKKEFEYAKANDIPIICLSDLIKDPQQVLKETLEAQP